MINEKYGLLMVRLFKPKQQVLELIPLLIAKSIHLIVKDNINETFDQIYGMEKQYQNMQVLFLYQFVITFFNENIELPLSTIDKM